MIRDTLPRLKPYQQKNDLPIYYAIHLVYLLKYEMDCRGNRKMDICCKSWLVYYVCSSDDIHFCISYSPIA